MKRKTYEPEDLGGGWFLQRNWMGSWIQFAIYKDRGDGFTDGIYETFSRKQDAMAYMAERRGVNA